MKKNLFMVAAVALMVFSACNKEEINGGYNPANGTIEFTAGFDAATKTTLVNGNKTEWVKGDAIDINGVKFTIVDESLNDKDGGQTATFAAVAEEVGENFGAPFTAVYPYGANGVPATQDAYAGNFDPNAVVETATSDDHNLSFKNESSLLKFQVSAACKTVTLTSDTELAKGSKTVTIKGDFVAGTDYYAAVIPGDKTNFSVKADGWLSRSADKVSINRTSIVDMGTVKAPGDWVMTGKLGDIHMVKSETYTELYVAKNVTLSSEKSFRFQSKDKSQTVGAWGAQGTEVDCKGQINYWYDSNKTNEYAADIKISTSGNYDVYFSPADLNFLIIKTGVEETDSEWSVVGWINGKDSWSGNSGYTFKYNYILAETSITMDLTSNDYFKLLKNNNWTAGDNGGWVAAPGNDNGTKDYSIVAGGMTTVNTYHSYDNHKAQFHLTNKGTYKIILEVGKVYTSATVKLKRIK